MAGATSPQQGLDVIPTQVAKQFRVLLGEHLPGWSQFGEYNYQPGVTSRALAAQLGVLMQSGPHPGINNQLIKIFREIDAGPDNLKTLRLAAVVQFMAEASSAEALASGGARTGGYIAFSSASDPNLPAHSGGIKPTGAQLGSGAAKGGTVLPQHELTLSKIMDSQVGGEAVLRNPRKVGGLTVFDDLQSNSGPKVGIKVTVHLFM